MMNLNQTSKSLNAEVSGATEEALQASSDALERTRRLASQAMEKAGAKVRDLRYGATDLARRSATTVSDATAAAQRQLGQYARATRTYVSEEPVKSALIAAAIGAAVAALVLAIRRNRRDYD
jgi:ElaB/YqjD/DUF883 family membrane-anchored ribosome-binding protein